MHLPYPPLQIKYATATMYLWFKTLNVTNNKCHQQVQDSSYIETKPCRKFLWIFTKKVPVASYLKTQDDWQQ